MTIPVDRTALRTATILDSKLHVQATIDRYVTGVMGYLDHAQISLREVEQRQQACRSAWNGLMGMLARMVMATDPAHEPPLQHTGLDAPTELATVKQLASWSLGVLTNDEYHALYVALAYYTDVETLGEPKPDPLMDVARRLLDRLETPA